MRIIINSTTLRKKARRLSIKAGAFFVLFALTLTFYFMPLYGYADNSGNYEVYDKQQTTLLGTYAKLQDAINSDTTADGCIIVVIADDIIDQTQITKSVTITSNNSTCTLKRNISCIDSLLKIVTGKELTLKNIIIDGNKSVITNSTGSLVYVDTNSKLYLEDNAVLQNNIASTGGGIYNCGSTIIDGGIVRDNKAYALNNSYGGGIYNYNGLLTMNAGTISGNEAYGYSTDTGIKTLVYGGGIYNNNSTFIMNGGTISGNSSYGFAPAPAADCYGYGGGISNYKSTLLINNGNVSNNTAYSNASGIHYGKSLGGGVYGAYGSMIINGGTVSGNISTYGSGIFNEYGCKAIIHGGSLNNNGDNYTINGGGVYNNYYSSFYFCGGTITANNAGNGGGIYTNGNLYLMSDAYTGNINRSSSTENIHIADGSENNSLINICFDTQGGTYNGNYLDLYSFVTPGSKAIKPAGTLERSGYKFEGWYKEPACQTAWNFDTDTVNVNTNIYAKWKSGLNGVSVTTPPTKTTYIENATFDPNGMVVTATYDNGAKAAVSGYTVTPNVLTLGTNAVTISYTEDGVTKTADVSVTVSELPSKGANANPSISADLSWNATAAASVYHIYRNGIAIAKTTANNYSDSDIVEDTMYEYLIKAYDNLGNELAVTNPIKVSTYLKHKTPSVPTGVTGSAISPAGVSVSWIGTLNNNTINNIHMSWVQNCPNLASGKSYTKSESPDSQYTDFNNSESTDGILANDYPDGKSYGYKIQLNETKSVDIIIDLGSALSFNDVKVHKWVGANYYDADAITISASQNNVDFELIGSSDNITEAWHDLSFSNINARYIKVTFQKKSDGTKADDWLFINEIQVFNIENTPVTVNENLALGKSYIKSEQPDNSYSDLSENESTDGILAKDYADTKSYGYKVTEGMPKSVDVTLNLGSLTTLNEVKIHRWEGSNYYEADTINVYASQDGATFTLLGSPSKADSVWFDLSFSAKSAKYIKIQFNKNNDGTGGHDWLFIDEIQVYNRPTVSDYSTSTYEIEENGTVISNGISTAYTHTNMELNKQYIYRVREKIGTVVSAWSDPVSIMLHNTGSVETVATKTVTPEPTASVTPEPSVTVTPPPTAVVTPKPTVAVKPEPTETIKPEPPAVITPKPMVVATPEPAAIITQKPAVTMAPEPTTEVQESSFDKLSMKNTAKKSSTAEYRILISLTILLGLMLSLLCYKRIRNRHRN